MTLVTWEVFSFFFFLNKIMMHTTGIYERGKRKTANGEETFFDWQTRSKVFTKYIRTTY